MVLVVTSNRMHARYLIVFVTSKPVARCFFYRHEVRALRDLCSPRSENLARSKNLATRTYILETFLDGLR